MTHSPIDQKTIGEGALNRYGPTAAREVDLKQIRLKTKTVDAHAHLMIPAADAYIAPYIRQDDRPLMAHANSVTKEIMQHQKADRLHPLTDLADRIAILDTQGIDIQVTAPHVPQSYYQAAPEHTCKSSQIVNDGVAAFVAQRPDRFVGLGTVPMNDPNAAPKELERIVNTLGLRGVQILGNVNGIEISDPVYEPFWKKAADLGAVVMIHPDGFSAGQRLAGFYFPNVIGIPLDTTVALHYIFHNGLLERYPDLKIFSVHGGGYVAAYSARMDHAWGARRDAQGSLTKRPSDYLRKVTFDGLVFSTDQLEYLIRTYGADHVVLGTDYPFDMGEYYPIQHLMSVPSLSDEDRAKVAGQTAMKLFGIEE